MVYSSEGAQTGAALFFAPEPQQKVMWLSSIVFSAFFRTLLSTICTAICEKSSEIYISVS
jgi:hypothetical protein